MPRAFIAALLLAAGVGVLGACGAPGPATGGDNAGGGNAGTGGGNAGTGGGNAGTGGGNAGTGGGNAGTGGGNAGTGGGNAGTGGGNAGTGGGNAGTGGGNASTGGGVLIYMNLLEIHAVSIDTESSVSDLKLPATYLGFLGFNNGLITAVDQQTHTGSPDDYTVNLFRLTPNGLMNVGHLATFTPAHGYVSGTVQPSPDGKQFMVPSRESASATDPYISYVNVMDETFTHQFARYGHGNDAIWLSATTLLAVADDGLYQAPVTPDGKPVRVGPPMDKPGVPALSRDGKSMTFVQDHVVWVMGVDGTGLRALTARTAVDIGSPTFSPDGAYVALIYGNCTPISTRPPVIFISATASNQDLSKAPKLTLPDKTQVRSCGPLYWVAE